MFKKLFIIAALICPSAAVAANLEVKLGGIENNTRVLERFAYCKFSPAKTDHELTQNVSPAVSWSEGPLGTKSYALIVVDEDVPADFSPANKEGKIIAKEAKRRDFYHWGLIGITGNKFSLSEGIGKTEGAYGQQADNDFGNKGYDGPCPPWNDERLHKYHFRVYALDADLRELALPEKIHAKDALKAITPHILAHGEIVATYSTNPSVK